MKLHTTNNILIRSALILALAVCSPVQAQPPEEKGMMKGKMMEWCQEMREQRQQMMETAKAQDAALAEQITKMNAAPADKKTELIAATVTLMAEQRAAMTARKAKMEEVMTQHMMQHMKMGKESMADCPMMKGMKDTDDKKEDSGTGHHPE